MGNVPHDPHPQSVLPSNPRFQASSSNNQYNYNQPSAPTFGAAEYAHLANVPEDVALQMALQASMQTANNVVTGQAQGNNGDQDDINNGANDGDEE